MFFWVSLITVLETCFAMSEKCGGAKKRSLDSLILAFKVHT